VLLRYLYRGSADTGRELAAWLQVPGARLRWRFQRFGADVAAVDCGSPPVILIADHRPAGSVLPIYAVDDMDATRTTMESNGWTLSLGPMGTPEGPTCVLRDRSGGELALLRVDRPAAMDQAYDDRGNPRRA